MIGFLESPNLLHLLYTFSQSNNRISSETSPNLTIQYIIDVDFSLYRKDCKPLTLPKAIERALANYPTIRIQQTFVDQAKGQKTTAGILPNPTVSYYREDLNLAGENFGEWIIAAGLPFNFLWERWSKAASAETQVEAQELLVESEYLLAKAEFERVQRLYDKQAIPQKRLEEARLKFEAKKAGYDVIVRQIDFGNGANKEQTPTPHFQR